MVELIVRDNSGLHVWLIFLVVQPKLDYNHYLEIVIDVLNLVSFILIKVILDLLPRDVMEHTDLVESICGDALKPLTVLSLGKKAKLVIQLSDNVQLTSRLILDFTMLNEHGFVR